MNPEAIIFLSAFILNISLWWQMGSADGNSTRVNRETHKLRTLFRLEFRLWTVRNRAKLRLASPCSANEAVPCPVSGIISWTEAQKKRLEFHFKHGLRERVLGKPSTCPMGHWLVGSEPPPAAWHKAPTLLCSAFGNVCSKSRPPVREEQAGTVYPCSLKYLETVIIVKNGSYTWPPCLF